MDADFEYQFRGHRVIVRTLYLDQRWEGIHGELLELIDAFGSDPAMSGVNVA